MSGIRHAPQFVDFWPKPPWQVDADALEHDQPTLWADVQRAADAVLPESRKRALIAGLDRLAGEVLQALAVKLEVALPVDSGDLPVLRAMVALDLVRHWLAPHWRVKLSYRQLCQARLWTRTLVDAPTRPFALAVCTVEEGIAEAAQAIIRADLDPVVKQLRDEVLARLPDATPAHVRPLALAAVVDVLRTKVWGALESAYNAKVD